MGAGSNRRGMRRTWFRGVAFGSGEPRHYSAACWSATSWQDGYDSPIEVVRSEKLWVSYFDVSSFETFDLVRECGLNLDLAERFDDSGPASMTGKLEFSKVAKIGVRHIRLSIRRHAEPHLPVRVKH